MKKYWFKSVHVGFLNRYFCVVPLVWQGWAVWIGLGALYISFNGTVWEYVDSSTSFSLFSVSLL